MNGRIIVLGGAGMLGHKLFQILRERFPGTLATTRQDVKNAPYSRIALLQGDDVLTGFDAANFDAVRARLAEIAPDVIVNCVGVIKQRREAMRAIPSITLNSLFPHRLAELAGTWGGRVIHFSTDCVFSGIDGRYTEESPSDAQDLYGRTKFLGELHTANAVTLRTSIIGRELSHRQSLLEWLLSQNGRKVRGFRRVIYSGITTNEMANLVTSMIADWPQLSGLFQVVSEPITKYDLLLLLRDAYTLDLEIEPDDTEVSDRSLRGDRFRAATGWRAPSWPELVRDLAADPTPYEAWQLGD